MADHPDGRRRRLTIARSGELYLVHDGTLGRLCNPATGWTSPRPAPLGTLAAHAHADGEWVVQGQGAELPDAVRALAEAYPDWPAMPPTFDDLR